MRTGKSRSWFGTNTDITELRNTQDALRKSKEFTEEQVRARTRELEVRNTKVLQQSEQLRELVTQNAADAGRRAQTRGARVAR